MFLVFWMCTVADLLFFNQNQQKEITKNGMTFRWEIVQDSLIVSAFAPTQGWVAIGFNERDELKGTHLVMGCVKDGASFLEDHYIRQPGDHLPVGSLGGVDALQHRWGKSTQKGTRIGFRMPLKAVDLYHWNLEAGKDYYLLLAYSESDDFYHHSRMRVSVRIQL